MNKLGLKMNIAGWIMFGISFLIINHWGEYMNGIATGLFISSLWVALSEYKNQ
jgi:hypothetical protein